MMSAFAVVLILTLTLPAPVAIAEETPPDAIHLHVETSQYEMGAQGVDVPGLARSDRPGQPALPVWSTLVTLPPGVDWQISYESPQAQVLAQRVQVPAVPVPELDAPGPHGWAASDELPGAVPSVNRPDPAVYGVNAFYPQSLVETGAVQWSHGQRLLPVRVFPFQYNPVTQQVRYHPDVQIAVRLTPGDGDAWPAGGGESVVSEAAVATGALRIRIEARGLYRLTYDNLLAAGGAALVATDPATYAMSYLGQPIDIEVRDDGDASFEPGELVIFYAQPYQGRYQKDNVYWFTYGGAVGSRMAERSVTSTGSEPVVNTITRTLQVELNKEYRSEYPQPQDADHWFDLSLTPDMLAAAPVVTRTYDLAVVAPIPVGTVRVQAALHGGANRPANPDKSVAIVLNSHPVTTHQWEGMTYTVADSPVPAAWLDGAPNRIHLVAALAQLPGIDFYSISPDWVKLTYPSQASATGDRLYIEGVASGANQIVASGFSTPDVQVYDLRDPNHPVRLLTTETKPDGSTYLVSFWDAPLPDPTYFLSSQAALLAPQAIEADTPSSWRTTSHQADYIAIVHASLWDAIDPLLAHRAAEGLRVAKVDVQDIYDEWSYGRRDPEAIRSFLAYAYRCWNGASCAPYPAVPPYPPQYVVLVGDGHYDFTGASGTTMPNLIPPYLIRIDPWIGETASDNRFVSVDGPGDFLPEMAIGRIPARNATEVANVVNKIIAYETTALDGDWQKRVVYVADNYADPAANFHALSDDVRLNWLPATYTSSTIYYNRDYFSGDAMRAAIKDAFNADALLLQWFGHASTIRWGGVASMFNYADPPALAANDTWPFTTHYSCWSGYFINLYSSRQTLGETLLLTAQRGSVADLSPSGLHVGSSLLVLNQQLTKAIFQDRTVRAGDAVDAAKLAYYGQAGSWLDVIDTSIFFGDPALNLRLPPIALAVDLAAFDATAQDGAVRVAWETVSEHDTVGFRLYRSQSAGQVGEMLAFMPSQSPGSSQGASYEYIDRDVVPGQSYWYTLEDLDSSGVATRHGPISVDYVGPTAVTLSGVSASPAAGASASAWLWVAVGAGAALGLSRSRRRG